MQLMIASTPTTGPATPSGESTWLDQCQRHWPDCPPTKVGEHGAASDDWDPETGGMSNTRILRRRRAEG
ncbi:hypothetical protein CGCF413_v012143 [Colletotrichum fructicola]|nr:hypothetical protein CGCF413_v012143 [Colletotrichum fructicola]